MPLLLDFPLKHGRKPPSIPDTTQFSGVTQFLFGVPCATPGEPFRLGTYNELYLLHLYVPADLREKIPQRVLARVSRDVKTKSDISMESEIATMMFVRSRTKIPVPTVYGYCPTRDNAIGQPFCILSFTEGTDMNGSAWENLPTEVKLLAIRDYARIVLELSRLKFDRIASIYFKERAPPPHCYELGPVAWCKHESAARKACCRYDRGPWQSASQWLRAALSDEIETMQTLPDLLQSTHKSSMRGDDTRRWQLAHKAFPQMLNRVSDVIEDPLDRYGAGPFVLSHMELTPRNMIFATEGPHMGRIVAVIDWEMATTTPLWALACYPSWFERIESLNIARDIQESQLFKDTYIRELQKHTHDPEILSVVQNARAEQKRRFTDIALLSWPRVDLMLAWMDQNPVRR
ncbi:serine threonine protein kinase [Moniliophthora roreri MCA 2997]|uniref:Serine threonine protein kinase n=1 Tax=Moniliophthora roreri (strain MCA 2997) TaxID=1381753 RepID=V2XT69_MONRO|nr:serine threonine protein kinase [Moniliophthora roreri MCA 2997]